MDWQIEYAVKTAKGTRSVNQDAYLVVDDERAAEKGCLFVICHAFGDGEAFAQQIAAQTAKTIAQSYHDDGETGMDALNRAATKANEALIVYNNRQAEFTMWGVEATILLILDQHAQLMHIGNNDRRSCRPFVVCKQAKKLYELKYISLVTRLVEAGIISENEVANRVPFIDYIPSHLGCAYISPLEETIPLSAQNRFFLRSSSLWVEDEVVLSALEKDDVNVVCQEIFAAANEYRSRTAIVVSAKQIEE